MASEETELRAVMERFESLEERLEGLGRSVLELRGDVSAVHATLDYHVREDNLRILAALDKQDEMKAQMARLEAAVGPVVKERTAAGTVFKLIRNWAALAAALTVLGAGATWLWERLVKVFR